MENCIFISLFFPLLSAFLAGLFSFSKRSITLGIICSLLICCSAVCLLVLFEIVKDEGNIVYYLNDFIYVGFLKIDHIIILDPLSVMMAVIVGIVSSVVHVYSIWYMANDKGFNRFFSYLGLFVFSMLILVLSDNFVGLFIGWEGVGLCSWLLIGFWYDKKGVSWCANEAFIMNRIADLGLLLAIFLIHKNVGSLRYADVFVAVPNLNQTTILWIALLLFIGAMGKSAQFPFHTWLADAMAGPTPVSALIHAATMVTAGVYLVIRANSIFIEATLVSEFIIMLGAGVAFFAASMAMVCDDLKKIIAYSTLSQLGYMFVAAGFGAYWIALFHLTTHAFFKSLLFLCAGNVMHAMNDELDIKKMGGLYKYMKPTTILMIIGSLALCGYYPFAGFFSKDKILEVAFSLDNYIIWTILLVTAMMTAFYSFRLIMLVFFGKSKFTHTPFEVRTFVLVSLVPLAILAIIFGFFEEVFYAFVVKTTSDFNINLSNSTVNKLLVFTLICVVISTLFVILFYKKEIFKFKFSENQIYKFLKNEYYIPQIYEKIFIKGYEKTGEICYMIDKKIIDTSVDLIAKTLVKFGNNTNKMQSGNLSLMLMLMVAGFMALLTIAFMLGGK